jgi:cbb3-type cytochrome oxidase subunit 1
MALKLYAVVRWVFVAIGLGSLALGTVYSTQHETLNAVVDIILGVVWLGCGIAYFRVLHRLRKEQNEH